MTNFDRYVLFGALVVILCLVVFPPWVDLRRNDGATIGNRRGHAFLGRPPDQSHGSYSTLVVIDSELFPMQIGVVCVLALLLCTGARIPFVKSTLEKSPKWTEYVGPVYLGALVALLIVILVYVGASFF